MARYKKRFAYNKSLTALLKCFSYGLEYEKLLKEDKQKVAILAPGGSLNSLAGQDWDLIRNHYTIGLSTLVKHIFTCDEYLFEPPGFVGDKWNSFKKHMRTNRWVFVRYGGISSPKKLGTVLIDLYHAWKSGVDRIYFSPEVYLRDMRKLDGFWKLKRETFIRGNSGIATAILMAVQLGACEIAIGGCDLSSTYFFEDDSIETRSFPKHLFSEGRRRKDLLQSVIHLKELCDNVGIKTFSLTDAGPVAKIWSDN